MITYRFHSTPTFFFLFYHTKGNVFAKTSKSYYHYERKRGLLMLFIEYPPCSTCKKAKKYLTDHHIAFEARHIVENNPSYKELALWHKQSQLPLKKFFNPSGKLYKEMQLKDKLKDMSEEEQLQLLASNGMLVKRPLLIHENTVLVGFKEEDYQSLCQ